MANSVQYLLGSSKESKIFSDLMEKIQNQYSIYFNKTSNLKCEFLTTYLELEEIREVSADGELTITLMCYDTAIGYAKKYVYSYGLLTSLKSARFGMDFEILVNDNSIKNNTTFEEELIKFIDLYGEEESNFPKTGDLITIDESYCNDDYLLGWLESQKTPMFKVVLVEPQSNGLWIENCNCRIDLDLCTVIKASKPSINIDFNDMEDIREKVTQIFSNHNPDINNSELGKLLISVIDLSSEIACEAHDDDKHSLTNIVELATKIQYDTETFIKSTINEL